MSSAPNTVAAIVSSPRSLALRIATKPTTNAAIPEPMPATIVSHKTGLAPRSPKNESPEGTPA